MIKLSYLLDRIRDVKPSDYLSVFPMVVALLIRPLYRKRYEGTWLICEEPAEARDNGYHFFKYMCQKQPQQKCYYAIKKKSVDAMKVVALGNTIEYGSIQHWLAYFLCRYNISSQKGGKPNAALCAFMEMNHVFKTENVFLQHGVTINNVKWLYANVSNIKYFITATTDETEYIRQNFGYPAESIVMTGFPRFDALHNIKINKGQIVIMPTWRYWFNLNSKKDKSVDTNITTSVYVQKWTELLKMQEFVSMLKAHNLKAVFYLHRNMQNYIANFADCGGDNVIIANWKEYDLQQLLINSEMLITDYSSVFFDMIYMKKPVLFYQFDQADYRRLQYNEGYFNYEDNPFGEAFTDVHRLVEKMYSLVREGFKVSDRYLKEHNRILTLYDANNSKRVFQLLSEGECHQ